MPNLMQGHCRKVLKVSEQSTSVEKFVEALDNGAPPVLPAVLKGSCAHDECEPSANVIVATCRLGILCLEANVRKIAIIIESS